MHEISLCEGVLQVLEEQAQTHHFTRVKTVRLEIGALSCVESEALRFAFAVVMKGSLAEGARLEIITIPGEGWCPQCRQAVAMAQRFDPCPRCGGYQLRVTGGEEMRIKELAVEAVPLP